MWLSSRTHRSTTEQDQGRVRQRKNINCERETMRNCCGGMDSEDSHLWVCLHRLLQALLLAVYHYLCDCPCQIPSDPSKLLPSSLLPRLPDPLNVSSLPEKSLRFFLGVVGIG